MQLNEIRLQFAAEGQIPDVILLGPDHSRPA
jgi:hypothetical protein